MAKSFIKVNTEAMSSDVEELRELLNNSTANLDKMYESVTTLDSMWEGPANESFVAQFSSDYTAFKEICSLVSGMIDDMDTAKAKYNSCEDEVYALIASIKL